MDFVEQEVSNLNVLGIMHQSGGSRGSYVESINKFRVHYIPLVSHSVEPCFKCRNNWRWKPPTCWINHVSLKEEWPSVTLISDPNDRLRVAPDWPMYDHLGTVGTTEGPCEDYPGTIYNNLCPTQDGYVRRNFAKMWLWKKQQLLTSPKFKEGHLWADWSKADACRFDWHRV